MFIIRYQYDSNIIEMRRKRSDHRARAGVEPDHGHIELGERLTPW